MRVITVSQLQEIVPGADNRILQYFDPLVAAMERFEINTSMRVAAFIATLAVESANFSAVEEGLSYSSADRLSRIFKSSFPHASDAEAYVRNPKALSQKRYQGFHGRGLIQLTWEKNYRACGEALGVDLVAHPELLITPQYAAASAGWFWQTNGCNEAADQGDMAKVTAIVNGPAKLHLAERTAFYETALGVLGV